MNKTSLIICVVLFSCCFAQTSFSRPMRIEVVLDLTPEIAHHEAKKFAKLSYVEYDIVHPGEMFLGPDRKAGTSDDYLYDPNGPDAGYWSYKWEFDFLYSSSNIAANNYDSNQVYHGFGMYDGGGLSSWFIDGLIWHKPEMTGNLTQSWGFESIDACHGNFWIGSWIFFPTIGLIDSVVVASSITPNCSPVPEPATALLFILGLAIYSCRRKLIHR